MNQEQQNHLNEEQIIRAVIDEADLSKPLREHLLRCDFCRAEKERFETQLSRLGGMAERLAPSPMQKVTLPVQEASWISNPRTWYWRSLLGAASAAAMIIALVWWTTPSTISPKEGKDQWTREMLKDEQLMTEIRFLEEHALPQIYFDISGESIPSISEEFMEFVIPPVQNETLNHDKTTEMYYVS